MNSGSYGANSDIIEQCCPDKCEQSFFEVKKER